MNHGALIRSARERKGLTQVQLAELVEVSQPTISRFERGEGTKTDDQIIALCVALGLTWADFAPIEEAA